MQIDLQRKSILLGVTGSISAYKACDLARLFVKAGANVHVVMTKSAERFVSALTFEALTRNPVLTETYESWSSRLNHIDIGKICDVFVIAPTTANTINKLSQGIADNILLQTALAYTKPILIAPAANTNMLAHSASQHSLNRLSCHTATIISPQEKLLACGDVGSGALAEPEEIFLQTARVLLQEEFWVDKEVIVTGGGSREKIDEVRYISNFSSGKMAKAICLALYLKGAKVHYLYSMDTKGLPLGIQTQTFEDAQDLLHKTQQCLNEVSKTKTSYLFMVAAVSDFRAKKPQQGKLKKSTLGKNWHIELTQTTDILSALKRKSITTVAFKAEMDTKKGLQYATEMMKKKEIDAVCYNLLKDAKSFGGDENEITFITKDSKQLLGRHDKLTLAFKIINEAKKLKYQKRSLNEQ